jgi:hypothetical protein
MIVGVIDAESTDLIDSAGLFTLSGIILNVSDLSDIEKQIADYKAKKKPEGSFHVVFNITEQYLLGRTFLASTQAWWVKKTTKAAQAAILEPTTPLKAALEQYVEFIQNIICSLKKNVVRMLWLIFITVVTSTPVPLRHWLKTPVLNCLRGIALIKKCVLTSMPSSIPISVISHGWVIQQVWSVTTH